MDKELKRAKQTIRAFMALNYTDERLVWLLAHARSGQLAFNSCCCFIGVATAGHRLRGGREGEGDDFFARHGHLFAARLLPVGHEAEEAFEVLGWPASREEPPDVVRRRRIVPIVLAELRRRERAAAVREGALSYASTQRF